jgi:hypothetical protein
MTKKELQLLRLIKESTEVLNEAVPAPAYRPTDPVVKQAVGGGRSNVVNVPGRPVKRPKPQAQPAWVKKAKAAPPQTMVPVPQTPKPAARPLATTTGDIDSTTRKPMFPAQPAATSAASRFQGLGTTGSSFSKPTNPNWGVDTSRYNPKPLPKAPAQPARTGAQGTPGTPGAVVNRPQPVKMDPNDPMANAVAAPRSGEAGAAGLRAVNNDPAKRTIGDRVSSGAGAVGRGIGTVASLPFRAVGGLLKGIGRGLSGKRGDTERVSTPAAKQKGGRVDTGKGVSYTQSDNSLFNFGQTPQSVKNAMAGKSVLAPRKQETSKAAAGAPVDMSIGAVQGRQAKAAEHMKNNPGDREGYMNIVKGTAASPSGAQGTPGTTGTPAAPATPATPAGTELQRLKSLEPGTLSPRQLQQVKDLERRQPQQVKDLERTNELSDTESEETGVGILSPRQKQEKELLDRRNELNIGLSKGTLTPDQKIELDALNQPLPGKMEMTPADPAQQNLPAKPGGGVIAGQGDNVQQNLPAAPGGGVTPGQEDNVEQPLADQQRRMDNYELDRQADRAELRSDEEALAQADQETEGIGKAVDTMGSAAGAGMTDAERAAKGLPFQGWEDDPSINDIPGAIEATEADSAAVERLLNKLPANDPERARLERELAANQEELRKLRTQGQPTAGIGTKTDLFAEGPQYVSNARLANIKKRVRYNQPITLEEQQILKNTSSRF